MPSLMCPMSKESFMVCRERGCMYSIEFDIKSRKIREINNGKSKYPYKKRNCCIEQLEIILCKIPTRVTQKRFRYYN